MARVWVVGGTLLLVAGIAWSIANVAAESETETLNETDDLQATVEALATQVVTERVARSELARKVRVLENRLKVMEETLWPVPSGQEPAGGGGLPPKAGQEGWGATSGDGWSGRWDDDLPGGSFGIEGPFGNAPITEADWASDPDPRTWGGDPVRGADRDPLGLDQPRGWDDPRWDRPGDFTDPRWNEPRPHGCDPDAYWC